MCWASNHQNTYRNCPRAHFPFTNLAGQSTYDWRRQPLHEARKETQGQSTYSRLIKADSTFDQLLSKNASKKTVPHDRSTKKPRSPAKTKRPNKTTQKATRQASPVLPMRPGYFPPVYSSLIYYPTQMWNGTKMNPWYIYSPFVYPGWGGTSILFILIHWSNGHGRERYNPKRPLCIGALLNDLHIEKPVTYIRFSSYAFGSSTLTKRQGAYVGHQKGPRGRSGHEAGRSAVRTVRGGGADGPRVRRVS
jgi:hypothetical protein